MLYGEIIAVCSQIHTKHINTLCGQNVELLSVTPGGTYSDRWIEEPSERVARMLTLIRDTEGKPTHLNPTNSHLRLYLGHTKHGHVDRGFKSYTSRVQDQILDVISGGEALS